MNIKLMGNVALYDGAEPSSIQTKHCMDLSGDPLLFVDRFIPIEDFDWNSAGLSLERIVKTIKSDVEDFDGIKIYKGSSRGSNLFAYEGNGAIYILSYGESQPARYMCELNAIVS